MEPTRPIDEVYPVVTIDQPHPIGPIGPMPIPISPAEMERQIVRLNSEVFDKKDNSNIERNSEAIFDDDGIDQIATNRMSIQFLGNDIRNDQNQLWEVVRDNESEIKKLDYSLHNPEGSIRLEIADNDDDIEELEGQVEDLQKWNRELDGKLMNYEVGVNRNKSAIEETEILVKANEAKTELNTTGIVKLSKAVEELSEGTLQGLNDHEGRIQANTNTLAQRKEILDRHEADIKQNKDKFEKFGKQTIKLLEGHEGRIQANTTTLANRKEILDDHENRIQANTTTLANRKEILEKHEVGIQKNKDHLKAVEEGTLESFKAVSTALNTNRESIDQLGEVTVNAIADHEVRIDANANNTAELAKATKLTADILERHNNHIGTNKTNIDKNEASIEANTKTVKKHEEKIAANEKTTSDLTTEMNVHKNWNENQDIRISRNSAFIGDMKNIPLYTDQINLNKKMGLENRELINGLQHQFDDFKKQTNSALAGVAAISSLPQPYGVGNMNVAFGVGHYDGETALAFGMGYRPIEQLTVRIGGSYADEMDEPVLAGAIGYEF